jgi:hypothetical protein
MKDDGFGDWRIAGVVTLAKDMAAAYPGGPSHKAGRPMYQLTLTKDSSGTPIGFTTPSPVALALSIAITAASRAVALRETVAFRDVITPSGPGKSVAHENLPHLYDYFECCMVTVAFSFQALEVFCNETIATRVSGTHELRRRNESTEEKLAQILPGILGTESPKVKGVWQRFKELKRIRDTTIHLKQHDAYSGDIDRESLLYQFFQRRMDRYPSIAVEMIDFFAVGVKQPRWLALAKERLNRNQ